MKGDFALLIAVDCHVGQSPLRNDVEVVKLMMPTRKEYGDALAWDDANM